MIQVSNANAWAHCPRQAWFLLHPDEYEMAEGGDPFDELVKAMGDAHEAQVLSQFPVFERAQSVAHTEGLRAAGIPVIYQPQLMDEDAGIFGIPDFLLREGDSYRVADAKLALSIDGKKSIKAQLGTYRRLAMSELPAKIFLGNGDTAEISIEDDHIAETFVEEMQQLSMAESPPETHYAYSKCSPCPFVEICLPEFRARDVLTLNPAVDARAARGLFAHGVRTNSELAESDSRTLPDVPYLKGEARRARAIAQAQSLVTGKPRQWQSLNLPSGNLIHFDVEADPMAANGQGEVYLWGMLLPPYEETDFDFVWADHDEHGDQRGWKDFLQRVEDYRERFANPVLVHYSPYEVTQIRHYAARYLDEDHPTVQWLLGDESPLFDLQKLVKATWVLPVLSYGLKAICRHPKLVNFRWRLEESGSQWSVVRYYDYLDATESSTAAAIRAEILTYNEDDVRATHALVGWLIDKNQL